MQAAHAAFEASEKFGRLALPDIESLQIAPVVQVNEAAAEDDAVSIEQASPQVGQVHGVEGFSRGEAQGFDLRKRERSRGCSERKFRLGTAGQGIELERLCIGGDENPGCANFFSTDNE